MNVLKIRDAYLVCFLLYESSKFSRKLDQFLLVVQCALLIVNKKVGKF